MDKKEIRDIFAASALQGLLCEPVSTLGMTNAVLLTQDLDTRFTRARKFSIAAYRIADAMMEEREETRA